MANSSSSTETYTTTKSTTEVTVIPRTVTQSEQIARYFTEDLSLFIQLSGISLARELDMPANRSYDNEMLIDMLFADLSLMLRNGLITGIHLLLSEPGRNPNSHAYPLRYHAMYLINVSERSLKQSPPLRHGGFLEPPPGIWSGARFVLVIDWNTNNIANLQAVRRPRYRFDWLPVQDHYDASMLIHYRDGRMTVDGASVDRGESASPIYLGR